MEKGKRTRIESNIYEYANRPDRLYYHVRDERGKPKVYTLKRGETEKVGDFKKRAHRERENQLSTVEKGGSLNVGTGTVADVYDAWKAAHFDNLAPRTRGFYASTWETHIRPALGHKQIKDLKVAHVDALYAGMKKRGLGSVTIRHCARTLNTLLLWAVLHEHAERNVAKGIKPVKGTGAKRDVTEGLPDDEGIARILAEASKEGPMVAALARTLLYSGVRLGEALALTWGKDGIDLDKRTLKVTRARTGLSATERERYDAPVFGPPKSESGYRTIPLGKNTVAVLADWRRAQAVPSIEGLVFTRADGSGLTHQAADRIWLKITHRAGVTGLHAHDARHWCISHWIAVGTPIAKVSKWAGHANVAITLGRYTHDLKDGDGDALAAIEAAGG